MDGITWIDADIAQIRLPLPYALNSVNCYLLRGAGGWTLVDTGLNTAAARAQWKAAMQALGIEPDDIEKIVLTHMHPDHFGMAGWWQRLARAPMPLFMPAGERELAQFFFRGADPAEQQGWMLDCGMELAAVERIESALQSTRDLTQPHPLEHETVADGAELKLGERRFRAMQAPGHSDGQLMYYEAADRLLLCGDHVLMKITPNIGSWLHTAPDPLGRYLASLEALRSLDPRLALPGHKQLITDWSGRIEELLAHHAERLRRTLESLEGGDSTVLEVAGRLFQLKRLTAHEWRFALAETLAHLECLEARGRTHCEREGHMRWRLA